MSLLKHTPILSLDAARQITRQHFGIETCVVELLPSERDQNFLLTTNDDKKFVLKIANRLEQRSLLEAQNAMMQHLAKTLACCPDVVAAKNGSTIVEYDLDGVQHLVRMVSFVNGVSLASIGYRSPALLVDLAKNAGQLQCALSDFDHPAFHRDFHWDLANARQIISGKVELIHDNELRETIRYFADQFDRHTADILDSLPKSVIHNDVNDGNVIVDDRVAGIIDFGDAVHSWSVAEIAIAIAYSILQQTSPLALAAKMVAAFHAESGLCENEVAAIYGLVCIRLCVSAVIAAEQQQQRPDDPYLSISQLPIRQTLPLLKAIPYKIATETFRSACGFSPDVERVTKWIGSNHSSFVFPVVTGIEQPRFTLLDVSVSSSLLPQDLETKSVSELTTILFKKMIADDAHVGVGRYLEPRIVYSSDQFGSTNLDSEKRTIHLGIDLFAPAGATVVAPLDAVVECVVKIDLPLDYGNLVILRHEPQQGVRFYTLYGHLSDQTQQEISIGQSVSAGDRIGWLGDENENGGWSPHLHFQVMLDLLDYEKDFPGVCVASQREAWSTICPDPNLLLNLPNDLAMNFEPTKSTTLSERKKRVGPSLSIGYEEPVKMVRGWKHWLYDETGRKFLDAYNNVPHVGHCNSRVVQALTEQAGLLNTNTRYLSDSINQFAERLAATMPDPLNVCYFLNSASEANELALRLAETFTNQRDMIVLEGAYHGHTSTLIDISPYKHAGPGGRGMPDWVHVAKQADTYRGPYRNPETAGELYADDVKRIVDELNRNDRGLRGFIAESCPSVGGQIIFPGNYLASVYKSVRSAGGVCIADEVQTGYGRLGSVFYGFELQNVVPDIVVLGKPIGNGHPLAAVVTTSAIANAFDNGMEFFSTFGGNNVSCRVGLAVLDVMQAENFQQQALETGKFLLSELERLQSKHDLIGDVRGSGLFLGVELVRDRTTLQAAAEEATFIVNRMRERGILLGTDGPLHNVIKIRPPMTFGIDEARQLIATLD